MLSLAQYIFFELILVTVIVSALYCRNELGQALPIMIGIACTQMLTHAALFFGYECCTCHKWCDIGAFILGVIYFIVYLRALLYHKCWPSAIGVITGIYSIVTHMSFLK